MIPGTVQSSTKFKFCIPNLNKLEISECCDFINEILKQKKPVTIHNLGH